MLTRSEDFNSNTACHRTSFVNCEPVNSWPYMKDAGHSSELGGATKLKSIGGSAAPVLGATGGLGPSLPRESWECRVRHVVPQADTRETNWVPLCQSPAVS